MMNYKKMFAPTLTCLLAAGLPLDCMQFAVKWAVQDYAPSNR